MTLLKRILNEKRMIFTFVGLIMASDFGLYGFAVYPWSNRVSQAEARAAATDAQLRQARTDYTLVSQTTANKINADKELQRFYTEVLPADLAGARSISSPFLARLAEDTDLVLERGSSTPEKREGSPLARLRTTMVLAGQYTDIRQFIYELETATEFILIEEVILSRAAESDEELVLTLGVSTYYWAGLDAAL